MAQYFFDLHDGEFVIDEVGVECADIDAVRRQAKRTLPELERDILPEDGDQHTIRVVARDREDKVVYTATLIFNGQVTRSRF